MVTDNIYDSSLSKTSGPLCEKSLFRIMIYELCFVEGSLC